MTEIASASHEQSSGIDQINKAITQMDNVVQMNASLVEEATAAATSMAQQASGLASAVAVFRVDESAAAAGMAAAPAAEALMHYNAPAQRPASPPANVATRREPALASPESDEWKEF
jgi:methyl-accepting chemotaxis protein